MQLPKIPSTASKGKEGREKVMPKQPEKQMTTTNLYESNSKGPYAVFIKTNMPTDSRTPSLLEISRWLTRANVKFDRLDKITRFQWEASFNSRVEANNTINNPYLLELKLEAFIPRHKLFRKGVINGVPFDVTTEELTDAVTYENVGVQVNNMFRLKRKNRTTGIWEDSGTMVIEFKGQSLPDNLIIWRSVIRVSSYVPAVRFCFKCGLMGHLSKYCNKEQKCLTCAGFHPRDPQCALTKKCINCDGPHRTLDRECPAFIRRSDIAQIMARNNLSYLEAARLYEGRTSSNNASPPTFNEKNFPILPQKKDDFELAKFLSGNMKALLEAILFSPQADLLAKKIWKIINLHKEEGMRPSVPPDKYNGKHKRTVFPILKNTAVEREKS